MYIITLFNSYRYRYVSRWFLKGWCTGRDSILGSWWSVGFFPHISPCCRFGAILLHHYVGRIHICKVVFLLILACWLTRWGVMLLISMRTICSLYACVPWPELSAPLTLVKHHTHKKVGLSLSLTHRQVWGGSPGPAICVSQHHWA